MTVEVALRSVRLPDFGDPGPRPELPAALHADRVELLRAAAAKRGYDTVVVYADREHSANLAFLTGFDPRFEEAVLLVGRDGDPAILVGNECWGTAGAAPLPMRRHLFQDLSLQDQPRDRSRSLADILGDEGIRAGARVGVAGWKPFPDRSRIEVPSYLVDELRRLDGPVRTGRERQRPVRGSGRRPARDQRSAPAGGPRACIEPDIQRRAQPHRTPAARPPRGRGGPSPRLGRHTALMPRDADRRSARGLRAAEPGRAADRAGRSRSRSLSGSGAP